MKIEIAIPSDRLGAVLEAIRSKANAGAIAASPDAPVGAGFIGSFGALDFAGGAVVPINCDVAAYSLGAQILAQLKAVAVTVLWSGIGSALVFAGIRLAIGGRVAREIEVEGLDLREHGEAAYHA